MVPDPFEVRDESLTDDSSSVRLPSKVGNLRKTTSVLNKTVEYEKLELQEKCTREKGRLSFLPSVFSGPSKTPFYSLISPE